MNDLRSIWSKCEGEFGVKDDLWIQVWATLVYGTVGTYLGTAGQEGKSTLP